MTSSDEARKNTGSKLYVVLISMVAAFGGLLFGFDTAVISGVIPYIEKYFVLSGTQTGWIVSSLLFGCIIGVLFTGAPSDRFGRKVVLSSAALLFFISAIGAALAQSTLILILFRLIGGVAVGSASVISPMYIAEISPAKKRGRLVALNQLTIVIGILLAFISNSLIAGHGENSWRWMLCVMALPAILLFIALYFIPESPRWLMQKSNSKEAFRVLQIINGTDIAKMEIAAMEQPLNADLSTTFKDVFSPKHRKVIFIGIGLCVFQQFTGINIIMYYAPLIFEKAGLSINAAIFQTVSIGLINLIFTIIAMRLIDRIGRKPLLLIGSFVMAIALFMLSWTFFNTAVSSFLRIVFILVFIGAFALTWGPVMWVLVSEIFPNRVRGKAMSVAVVFLWASNFLITLLFPIFLEKIGGGNTFVFYGIIVALSFIFTLKYVPETKGKELEEIRI